jgi:hypothetical protein
MARLAEMAGQAPGERDGGDGEHDGSPADGQ